MNSTQSIQLNYYRVANVASETVCETEIKVEDIKKENEKWAHSTQIKCNTPTCNTLLTFSNSEYHNSYQEKFGDICSTCFNKNPFLTNDRYMRKCDCLCPKPKMNISNSRQMSAYPWHHKYIKLSRLEIWRAEKAQRVTLCDTCIETPEPTQSQPIDQPLDQPTAATDNTVLSEEEEEYIMNLFSFTKEEIEQLEREEEQKKQEQQKEKEKNQIPKTLLSAIRVAIDEATESDKEYVQNIKTKIDSLNANQKEEEEKEEEKEKEKEQEEQEEQKEKHKLDQLAHSEPKKLRHLTTEEHYPYISRKSEMEHKCKLD